jgi:hypothetical protein
VGLIGQRHSIHQRHNYRRILSLVVAKKEDPFDN